MRIKDLLEKFEAENVLPIDLNQVVNWIKAEQIQDEIEFVGVDLDVEVIRGYLHRFTYHKIVYGEPTMAASIYYDKGQGEEWINMVCAKELAHIMDGKACGSKEQFDTLVKRLALPKELRVLLSDPDYAIADKFGDAYGAALLLPFAARELLLEPYKAGEIKAADIAQLAVMPNRYVRMVMSDDWPEIYEQMKGI